MGCQDERASKSPTRTDFGTSAEGAGAPWDDAGASESGGGASAILPRGPPTKNRPESKSRSSHLFCSPLILIGPAATSRLLPGVSLLLASPDLLPMLSASSSASSTLCSRTSLRTSRADRRSHAAPASFTVGGAAPIWGGREASPSSLRLGPPPGRASLACAAGAPSGGGEGGGGGEEGSLESELAALLRERTAPEAGTAGGAAGGTSGGGDDGFDGAALAAIIRSKYEGRGYDVHLIRKGPRAGAGGCSAVADVRWLALRSSSFWS